MELSTVTRNCILQVVQVLRPAPADPDSRFHRPSSVDIHKVVSFCEQLSESSKVSTIKRSKSGTPLPTSPTETKQSLVEEADISRFCNGELDVNNFIKILEKRLLDKAGAALDATKVQQTTWDFYQIEKFGELVLPKWLSQTVTFQLWLLFNSMLESHSKTTMAPGSFNDILRNIVELCKCTWTESTDSFKDSNGSVDFPKFLKVIVQYVNGFGIETSSACGVSENQ